jgi:hypothetical protein
VRIHEDSGNLGHFLVGVAVIVTLAYLATQIRRNTLEVRSASLNTLAAWHFQFQRSVWTDPVTNKLWLAGMGGVALPKEEGRRFLFMVISLARLWGRVYNWLATNNRVLVGTISRSEAILPPSHASELPHDPL